MHDVPRDGSCTRMITQLRTRGIVAQREILLPRQSIQLDFGNYETRCATSCRKQLLVQHQVVIGTRRVLDSSGTERIRYDWNAR